jgi:rubrerythrin
MLRQSAPTENPPDQQEVEEHLLICTECGGESQYGAAGWRGYEADDDEILFFCPVCSAREFEAD